MGSGKRRPSKSRAVRAMLGRLGWHARPADVAAALREMGVEVSCGLVQRIKTEAAADRSGLRRRRAAARLPARNPEGPFIRKQPPPRTYRR